MLCLSWEFHFEPICTAPSAILPELTSICDILLLSSDVIIIWKYFWCMMQHLVLSRLATGELRKYFALKS